MRSVKTLLKLLGAVSLTTVATSSVITCGGGNETKAPELNGKYTKLLNWYSDKTTSKIEQKLVQDNTFGKEKYSIDADNSKIVPINLFKNKLLATNDVR